MRNLLAILFSILLLVSCTKKETIKTNNPLINNVNTMAQLLFDIHLAEALENKRIVTDKNSKILYTKVFEKHGITTNQFDSAIIYYTEHNSKYLEVYEKVNKKFNKYIELTNHSFFTKYPAENINIWKDYAVFPKELCKLTQFLPFYICPKPEYLNKPLIINK